MITKAEVEHIAKLARIRVSEKEKEMYAGQLAKILDYVDELKEVNTAETKPTHHVIDAANISRSDRVKKSNKQEKILSQAPQREGDFWRVKAILE